MSLLKNGNVIGGISKALLNKIGYSDLNTESDNICDAINEHENDISSLNSNLGNLHFNQTTLLTFGTYSTVGTIINLSDDYTNYDFLLFRLGSNTDNTKGGGAECNLIPSSIISAASSDWCFMFWINGSIQQITLQRQSNTQFKVIYRNAYGSSGVESGLRCIYGYKITN